MIFTVMGAYRITERYGTEGMDKEEMKEIRKLVEEEVKEITWNRIVQVIMLLVEKGSIVDQFKEEKAII